jgi:heat shock protein HtpX
MAVTGTILFGFYLLVGSFFAPTVGWPVVAGSVLFVGVQYAVGKWLALRSVEAEDLPRDRYGDLHDRVAALCDETGIDEPALKVGHVGTPNAFAVGRRGAGVVVVSRTLPNLYDSGHVTADGLEGVLAHELAHVKNRDVLVMLLGQSVASLVSLTVFFVVDAVLDDVPVLGFVVSDALSLAANALVMVFVLAISRYRAYVADEEAADLDSGTAAVCIFGGERGLLDALFATHPPVEERVERLRGT